MEFQEVSQEEEEEDEMPTPLNTRYVVGGHTSHNIITPLNGPIVPHHDGITQAPFDTKKMVMIRYKECLKNHAAAIGGSATDGCGEFMPGGEDGTLEALTCSACSCHRNFHRKEIDQGHPIASTFDDDCHNYNVMMNPRTGRKFYHVGSSHPDHDVSGEGGGRGVLRPPTQLVRKRFRTKFTQEQKDKMLEFAERVGWKMPRQDEAVVQQFCQEVGVKRRVVKVWMHNNKHSLAKKNNLQSNPPARNE